MVTKTPFFQRLDARLAPLNTLYRLLRRRYENAAAVSSIPPICASERIHTARSDLIIADAEWHCEMPISGRYQRSRFAARRR